MTVRIAALVVCLAAEGILAGADRATLNVENVSIELQEDGARVPQFEVASLKRSPDWNGTGMPPIPKESGGPGTATPARYTERNLMMRDLIVRAYGVQNYQISGPAWVEKETLFDGNRIDIDATMAPGTTKEQFRQMLQNLLAERFGLQAHRDAKEGLVYALVAAKGGPKMKANLEPPEAATERTGLPPKGEDGFPRMPAGYTGMFVNVVSGRTRVKWMRSSMPSLVYWLSNMTRRPVFDRTELAGNFDFTLEFENDIGASAADGESAPGIFAAIQEQLGLKLLAEKGPVETLVIDRVERTPVGN
jgi:uncharacterized protein (TIGR03435 family)